MCHDKDVIIVGAGIIGLSAAWRLAQRGVAVTVLDQSAAAQEASWAAAGMLAPGGEFESGETARFAVESLRMYPEYVRELTESTGCPIEYRVCGTLEIDSTADAAKQSLNGIRSQEVSPAEALELAPGMTPIERPARYYPDDALVNPRQVCHALLTACRSLGVSIVQNCQVQSITLDRHVILETSQGKFESKRAIIASGAWSGQIPVKDNRTARKLPGTFPVRGVLVGRTFPGRTLGPFLRREHSYLVQRENGYAIAGTTAERIGFDRTVTRETLTHVIEQVEALWPGFAKGANSESWLGFRPASESGEPHIGRFEDTALYLAYGHFRNGILMAPGTALKICSLLGV
jgi:glycine oxidase